MVVRNSLSRRFLLSVVYRCLLSLCEFSTLVPGQVTCHEVPIRSSSVEVPPIVNKGRGTYDSWWGVRGPKSN